MHIKSIIARDLPDLWFQAVNDILDEGRRFTIDKGSYEGQTRLEYDYFIGLVKHPYDEPLLPEIPSSIGIPNPVDYDYVFGGEGYSRSYMEYLMTDHKECEESYTYGERLTKVPFDKFWWYHRLKSKYMGSIYFPNQDVKIIEKASLVDKKRSTAFFNQIDLVIETYKKHGHRNNQMVLQIAQPSDLTLKDPPCLRHIDTKIQDNKLHFFVYFRSWDLWAGLPANLAAIQTLKEYMSSEIGVEDGEMIVESKGLHLYGYAEKLAKLRCMKG
jgi:thymidylate synthase